MSTLSDVVAKLEAFAEAEWVKVEAEGIKIVQELEPVVESAFATAVDAFGQLATSTVVNLMTAAYESLSGGEKLNLTATTIVEAAEKAGVEIATHIVTALAESAYTAVIGKAPPAANPAP